MAKFEVCTHKFSDLSESNYGVSILNDSKYGFATVGSLMRLSLLRAPKAPDAHADMGRHTIRYAIMPHAGPLDARTVRAGYAFNQPLVLDTHHNPSLNAGMKNNGQDLFSNISISGSPSLILDTVKRGEDDEDISGDPDLEIPASKRKGQSIVLRIYESLGGRSRGFIRTSFPVKSVWKCNVLEDDEEELDVLDVKGEAKRVEIELRAFEVATFRLQL
jgi:alpha-mannosidase